VILINLYNIFRNPHVVPDAEHFLPERFLGPTPPWWFIPYGHGPRKCIGANLSHTYMLVFLEQFYRAFDVELVAPSLQGQVRITHGPKGPLQLRLWASRG
jgi:cytochrome P450